MPIPRQWMGGLSGVWVCRGGGVINVCLSGAANPSPSPALSSVLVSELATSPRLSPLILHAPGDPHDLLSQSSGLRVRVVPYISCSTQTLPSGSSGAALQNSMNRISC